VNAFLWFLAACAGIAALGWTVGRITGARAHFLENWEFLPGETVLWRDDRADVMEVPRWGGAMIMSPALTRRWAVAVTDRRVILANRSLTGKRMVMHVLWIGASPDADSRKLGGGLLTRGYKTMAVERGLGVDDSRYVAFRPAGTEASSFNVKEIRVYTGDVVALRGIWANLAPKK
jgi:hypothetical protein